MRKGQRCWIYNGISAQDTEHNLTEGNTYYITCSSGGETPADRLHEIVG